MNMSQVGFDQLMMDGPANPLLAAVRHNRTEALETLLAGGARTEVRDDRGRTALAVAASNGLPHMCHILVANGASMIAINNYQR